MTSGVYKRSPYNQRPSRDTLNATDSIFRNGGSRSLLKLVKNRSGHIGTIRMGVQRS